MDLKLVKDYTTVLTGTGIARVISFFISIILARTLSTAGFGLYFLFFTIMILTWQLPKVIDSTYVRYVKSEAKSDSIAYLRTSFVIKVSIVTFLIFSSYPFGYLLANHVFGKPDAVFFITMAVITGAFLSLFSTLAGIYQAEEDFVKFSVVNILFYLGVISVIGVILLFRFALTPAIAVWVNTSIAVAVGFFGIFYIYKKIKYIFPIHISSSLDMFHFGKWLLAANVAYIIVQRLDILVLTKYVDYDALGVYSAAVRVAMIAALFTASVSVVLMPRGSQALKSLQHLKSYLREALMISMGLVFLVGVIIAISPILIKVLFGSRYMGALLPGRILLLAPVFIVLYTPLMYLFYAENKSKTIFELGMTILIAVICALLFLVPRYGTIGAAISITFSYFCGLIFVIFKSFKIIKKAYGHL